MKVVILLLLLAPAVFPGEAKSRRKMQKSSTSREKDVKSEAKTTPEKDENALGTVELVDSKDTENTVVKEDSSKPVYHLDDEMGKMPTKTNLKVVLKQLLYEEMNSMLDWTWERNGWQLLTVMATLLMALLIFKLLMGNGNYDGFLYAGVHTKPNEAKEAGTRVEALSAMQKRLTFQMGGKPKAEAKASAPNVSLMHTPYVVAPSMQLRITCAGQSSVVNVPESGILLQPLFSPEVARS